MMKRVIYVILALMVVMGGHAQSLKSIKLLPHTKERGTSVMKALENRRSFREFADKKLSLQDLSDLLWAANGINREDGRKTAASAMNKQDVDIFVILEEGAYLYNAKTNELEPVVTGDFRSLIGDNQAFVNNAPVCLLMVSDLSRFGEQMPLEQRKQWGAIDVGLVSQNIALFCSGCGLATVPRAFMKTDELKKVLKLSETQFPMLNNPVGYLK